MLLSIDHRVMLAVERGFSRLQSFLQDLVFEVFSVYFTAVAYLRHQGGTLSSSFFELVQRIEWWFPLILSLFRLEQCCLSLFISYSPFSFWKERWGR